MGLFEAVDRGAQAAHGEFAQLGVLVSARGFVGGNLGEAGDAAGGFLVGFGQRGDFRFERGKQLDQLALLLRADGARLVDAGLNFAKSGEWGLFFELRQFPR